MKIIIIIILELCKWNTKINSSWNYNDEKEYGLIINVWFIALDTYQFVYKKQKKVFHFYVIFLPIS